jgi:DNA-binding transcriptional regulator YdaS (Cro superfamily)
VRDIFNAHIVTENAILIRFEKHAALGSTFVARLLGVAYPTYAQYRSGRRVLPLYHERHIELLTELPKERLNDVIRRHAR